jgi:4-azaleucine resistance transporter AzlC
MASTSANPTATGKRSDFLAVTHDVGVVWASLFALGIGFGVLVTSHDLPWWLAPVISATVFAGSLEFLLIGMLAAAVPIAAIAATTFLVNSRHLFYGLSFPLDRVQGRIAKAYSIFALSDEAYAIITGSDPATLTTRRISWTQLGLHLSWAGGALIGGLVGATMLSEVKGLDFVLTALFVVLTLDGYRAHRDRTTLILGAAAAAIALLIAPKSTLLVAMILFTVALAVRHRANRRNTDG